MVGSDVAFMQVSFVNMDAPSLLCVSQGKLAMGV
jgi:hypothetical protein